MSIDLRQTKTAVIADPTYFIKYIPSAEMLRVCNIFSLAHTFRLLGIGGNAVENSYFMGKLFLELLNDKVKKSLGTKM